MAIKLDSYETANVDEAKIKRTIQFLKDLHIGLPGMLEMRTGFVQSLTTFIEKENKNENPNGEKIAGWQREILEAEKDITNIQRQQGEVIKKIERLQNLLSLPVDEKKVLTLPGSEQGTARAELSDLLNAIKARRAQEVPFEEKLVLDDMIEKIEGAKNIYDNTRRFASVQIVLSKPELKVLNTLPNYGARFDASTTLLEIEEQMLAEQNRLKQKGSKTEASFTYPLQMVRGLKKDLLTHSQDVPLLHTNDPGQVMQSAQGLLERLHENVVHKEEVSHPFKKFLSDVKNKVKEWITENIYSAIVPPESQFKTGAISSSFEMYRKASAKNANLTPNALSLPEPPSIEIGRRQKL